MRDTAADSYLIDALNHLSRVCHNDAFRAGWYHNPETGQPIEPNVVLSIALIHAEISEALEGYRTDAMDKHLPHRTNLEVELADALIRIHQLAGRLGLDLGGVVVEKMEYNRHREDHKPENRMKPGGKKF